jgi:hypothetical protein
MASGIKWNDASWAKMQRRFAKLQAEYPTATMQAAGQVAAQVIADAINEPPTVPIDTGNLRSSGTFEVIPGASWRSVKIIAGFNTPYAARVHEVPMNFQDPSAGNKYLEAKLVAHGAEYVRVWSEKTARLLGMA